VATNDTNPLLMRTIEQSKQKNICLGSLQITNTFLKHSSKRRTCSNIRFDIFRVQKRIPGGVSQKKSVLPSKKTTKKRARVNSKHCLGKSWKRHGREFKHDVSKSGEIFLLEMTITPFDIAHFLTISGR
jgi:hypothetical protein